MPFPSAFSTATVIAHRLAKERGATQILIDVDLTVGPEHRIGVVGPNGVGKSTLLRILAGIEPPDAGSVVVTPPESTIAHLAQEPDVDARAATVLDELGPLAPPPSADPRPVGGPARTRVACRPPALSS